jgi:hypothetical protein
MTDRYSPHITKVSIERETEHLVWINGNRVGKITHFNRYHNTWEQAHEYLLTQARTQLETLQDKIEVALANFAKIEGLKKP